LIEAEPSDHIAHGGLADLVDRVVDVLDRDNSFFRVGNMIVSDRRDIDRNIVFCNDLLRGICMVTVRKDTRTICWIGTKINVNPGPRTPANLPRRNTTPRSYCFNTRSETMT